MKKIIFLSLLFFFTLTGCGAGATETMSCSYETKNGNITTKMKYDIDHEDKEVKKVRITYDYTQDENTSNNGTNNTTNGTTNNTTNDTNKNKDTDNDMLDGVGTGTDGTTNDTQKDKDGIIDGVIGNGIDAIVGSVTDVILDLSGLKERHANVQGTYGNMTGFSVQNTTDTDNNYKVTYVIDFDTISDDDLKKLNLSRDIDTLKNNYISQGYTCK